MKRGDKWQETEKGEIIPPPPQFPEWRIKQILSKKLAPPGQGVDCVRKPLKTPKSEL